MNRMNRLKERAIMLPVLAFLLLTPPILLIFNSATLIFGIPLLYIYAFSVWGILMITGMLLTKSLQKADNEQQSETAHTIKNQEVPPR